MEYEAKEVFPQLVCTSIGCAVVAEVEFKRLMQAYIDAPACKAKKCALIPAGEMKECMLKALGKACAELHACGGNAHCMHLIAHCYLLLLLHRCCYFIVINSLLLLHSYLLLNCCYNSLYRCYLLLHGCSF